MRLRDSLHLLKKEFQGLWRYPGPIPLETDYEAYWDNKSSEMNSFQEYRARWVGERLESGASVADIASGSGRILKRLVESKSVMAQAYDLTEKSVKMHERLGLPCTKLDLAGPSALAAIPIFDHILAFEILEHLQDPERVLDSLLQKARKSVFISVPNTGYFTYRLRLLFGKFPVQWRKHPGEHIRFWTKKDMEWWLGKVVAHGRWQIHCYQGVPILNRVWPALFAKGLLVEIKSF